LIYIAIVGLGIYASMIFYSYVRDNYLRKTVVVPEEAREVYVVPLQDVYGDFWAYNENDLVRIRQLLGDSAMLAPVLSKKVAVQAGIKQAIIAGISCSESFHTLFSIPMLYGNQRSANEKFLNKCVLSFEANLDFFQGDNSVGKIININGEMFEITGVAAPKSLGFLNVFSSGPVVLIPEAQYRRIDPETQHLMYYNLLFVRSNIDQLAINRLYDFINEVILPERDINKRLRSIVTLDRYLQEQFRDQRAETLLLLFIVGFGFFTSLIYQINLSFLFNLNRIRNIGIGMLLGASFFGIYSQIFIVDGALSLLGLVFSILLSHFVNWVLLILGSQEVISFNYNYLYILLITQLIAILIASLLSLLRIKSEHPLQVIRE
jgi:putative ABC transport system permease protein